MQLTRNKRHMTLCCGRRNRRDRCPFLLIRCPACRWPYCLTFTYRWYSHRFLHTARGGCCRRRRDLGGWHWLWPHGLPVPGQTHSLRRRLILLLLHRMTQNLSWTLDKGLYQPFPLGAAARFLTFTFPPPNAIISLAFTGFVVQEFTP